MNDHHHELQLLGTVLRCQTHTDVLNMTGTVPPEAFHRPLDAAIWRAAGTLADNGVADPVAVVRTVVAAGLWPRDLHHEVTVRVVDAITASRFDPHEWHTPAVDVLHAYARRTAAAKLSQVARILRGARLHTVARDLFAVAEIVQTAATKADHVDAGGQVRAA
jgi:hypothetical protein